MSLQDYLSSKMVKGKNTNDDLFSSFRKQIENVLDDYNNGVFGQNSLVPVWSNVSETDTEIRVTAELPGLTNADIDVSVVGDLTTIKGEKKSEKEKKRNEKGREFHMIERSSGSFRRTMTLPFDIDADTVKAAVKDGVLTVTISNPLEAVEKVKKIKVTHT
ncbi:Hsp20/alpha crystallin family protein [Pseudorhodobacter sp. W20_MBD10_FR17]|uniref:Hsp20/alpha crystallin family protein n=1 Tax=Pseudorhodobacter sp. W20_MBD10_FR17 TaxID=3240266 RepID=UPI003F99723F